MARYCAECGATWNIEKHHVFNGPNRKISEKYGMVEDLCPECHRGAAGIHFNKEMAIRYKQKHQILFEDRYGHEMFMRLIGRNYL
jgi:lysyl-tRNA synthetase class I